MKVWKEADLPGLPERETRLAVIGDPVHHSLSPAMHTAALGEMNTLYPDLTTWSYGAIELPAHRMPEVLPQLHAKGFQGLNLTIPHKVDVLPLLQAIDPEAEKMGAVNTLVWQENGYKGYNTDGFGIVKAIKESFGIDPSGQSILMMGAGGAARAIAIALLLAGAKELLIVNRNEDRLSALIEQLRQSLPDESFRVRAWGLHQFSPALVSPDLIINATSLGLREEDPSPLQRSLLTPSVHVYDTTYGVHNQLAKDCEEAGAGFADGLSMLVWQGVRSLEIWTGKKVRAESMRSAALKTLDQRRHFA